MVLCRQLGPQAKPGESMNSFILFVFVSFMLILYRDLEVEYQRLGDLLEPSEAEWKRILSSFTESLSTIEMV